MAYLETVIYVKITVYRQIKVILYSRPESRSILYFSNLTVSKKEGKKVLEEFGKRNIILLIVVRRDIHYIIENSKVYREGRMPYCLVPKITHYCKEK